MGTFSLIGIALGVAAFVFLSFKGFNMFLNCIIASIIVAITGQMDIFTAITDTYMKAFSNYVSQYFLLFFISALFGRIMDDCGAVRKVALSIASITKKSKNPKFWTLSLMPFFYAFLGYSGVNGFVCIFTILAIGRELFTECDIPWRLYPIGSAGMQPAIILGGSIYITNIMIANEFGTPLTAMMGLSIACTAACILTIGALIWWELRKFEKRGEGFLPSGEAIRNMQLQTVRSADELPNIFCSAIPLISPVAIILIFKLSPINGLLLGSIIGIVMNYKYLASMRGTINNGLISAGTPIINTCGAVGFAAIIRAAPGFQLLIGGLSNLPGVFSGLSLVMIMCAVVGSSSTFLPATLPIVIEKFTAVGISAELGHRLTTLGITSYMTPHNSGPVNAITLCKLNIREVAWLYFKMTFIPGTAALLVALAAYGMGIVH